MKETKWNKEHNETRGHHSQRTQQQTVTDTRQTHAKMAMKSRKKNWEKMFKKSIIIFRVLL